MILPQYFIDGMMPVELVLCNRGEHSVCCSRSTVYRTSWLKSAWGATHWELANAGQVALEMRHYFNIVEAKAAKE